MNAASLIKLLNFALVISVMFSMGLKVNLGEVSASMRHLRPMALGLIVNFILVPLTTLLLLYLFAPLPIVATGFLIFAVFPGSPPGPPLSETAKGDVPYAVALMVTLVGLSVLISPFLLDGLLGRLYPEIELNLNPLILIKSLVLAQLLPLLLGLGIHRWSTKWTERILILLKPISYLLFFLVVVLILTTHYPTLAAIRLRGWVGMMLLWSVSLGLGWVCGGPGRAMRKTLSLTTALRNFPVALLVVSANFPGTPAVTAVVGYVLFSILGGLGGTYFFSRIKS